jgi:hypothetical protein
MATTKTHSFFFRNSLSIVVMLLMIFSLGGQVLTGWTQHNADLEREGNSKLELNQYLTSGHFISTTFENWESEFLQMALYVLLTISLRQVGSSESKPLEGKQEVDRDPKPHTSAPWPVRRGGVWLKIYSNSLSLAFGLLFLCSFVLHFYGSLKEQNAENMRNNFPPESAASYIVGSRFWFESFQNWQSEFLSVASIVVLSIWLRQKGSPESKPVDAPYMQTGD